MSNISDFKETEDRNFRKKKVTLHNNIIFKLMLKAKLMTCANSIRASKYGFFAIEATLLILSLTIGLSKDLTGSDFLSYICGMTSLVLFSVWMVLILLGKDSSQK